MRWPLAVGIIGALVSGIGGALAAPLDEETCKGIKAEREGLIAKGIEADIARGPEWGKANLPPDRLKEVGRMIELTEQLTFRCGQLTVARPDGKPLLKKAEPPPAAPGTAAAKPAAAAAAGTGDPLAKPAAKKKKKPTAATKPTDAFPPPPDAAGAGSQKAP